MISWALNTTKTRWPDMNMNEKTNEHWKTKQESRRDYAGTVTVNINYTKLNPKPSYKQMRKSKNVQTVVTVCHYYLDSVFLDKYKLRSNKSYPWQHLKSDWQLTYSWSTMLQQMTVQRRMSQNTFPWFHSSYFFFLESLHVSFVGGTTIQVS